MGGCEAGKLVQVEVDVPMSLGLDPPVRDPDKELTPNRVTAFDHHSSVAVFHFNK